MQVQHSEFFEDKNQFVNCARFNYKIKILQARERAQ